jgi:hypothetical protein
MRGDGAEHDAERARLAEALPALFSHYAKLCGATRSITATAEQPSDARPNFGTLSPAGYARAFFDGMSEDVVPGLIAIGLPEAEDAYARLLHSLG